MYLFEFVIAGLEIPQGEISVYKDSSGELVLVVHADEGTSKSVGDPESGNSNLSEKDQNKLTEMEQSEVAASSADAQLKVRRAQRSEYIYIYNL